MAVTVRQIADHLQLSYPTVVRILGRDAHLFREETRTRVLTAAKEMGYRPNSAAKSMKSGRFNCVSMVQGHDAGRSDLPVDLLMGVQDELARRDMHLAISRLPDEKLTSEGFVPKVLRESMADGILINYTHDIPTRMLELIRAHHAPAIWVNTKLPVDCVYPDDLSGSRMLTEHLLSLGHRKILYSKFDWASHYSTTDRLAGYEQAMRLAGLQPTSVSRVVLKDERQALVKELLTGDARPTAIICRPEDANTFAYVARGLGMEVPRDLSIACISGQLVDIASLPATTALVPAREEGQAAVQLLIEKIKDPAHELPARVVPFRLIPGASVAPYAMT